MLSTNRISIKNEDLSASLVSNTTRVLGYTVVDAEKGPCKPVRIPAGSTEKIQSIFGYTSSRYPMIQEALDFNAGYDLFISAPYDATCSKVGIAYVTDKGIFAADPVELNGAHIEDLSEDSDIEIPGITSNLSMRKAGSFISGAKIEASGKTVVITKNDQAVNLKEEDTLTIRTGTEERTVLIKADADGSLGAYSHVEKSTLTQPGLAKVGTVTAGTIAFNSVNSLVGDFFHEESIEANLKKSSFKLYQAGENFEGSTKVYAVIYQKYASNRTTKISYKAQKIKSDKIISFTVSEAISPIRTVTKNYTLSLDVSAKDGFGASLGYDSVLANDSFIGLYLLNDDIEGAEFAENKDGCDLEGTRVSSATLEDGWLFPEKPEYGDVDLFFNSEVNPDLDSSFFTLANRTPYPVQGFLFSLTPTNLENLSPLSFGSRYWNICGKFTRVSTYTKEKYVSGLVGNRALMQAKIIENSYGGAAPMFLNENGLGGQLGVSVRKALNSWDKDEIDVLTDNNYNPVVKDPTYGLLLVGQKTCQEGVLSDWSYIGHVCSFIALEKALIETVLIPQIGKPNNDYYRDLRKTQVEAYLSPRISGSKAIWADAIVDTSTREGVNDEAALAAKEFRIVIKVQPNIYSEYVTLTLSSYPQGVELS